MTNFQMLYECDLSRVRKDSPEWEMLPLDVAAALLRVNRFLQTDPLRLNALGDLGILLLHFARGEGAVLRMWLNPARRTAFVEVVGDSLRLTPDNLAMASQIARAGNGSLSVTGAEGSRQSGIALVAEFPLEGEPSLQLQRLCDPDELEME